MEVYELNGSNYVTLWNGGVCYLGKFGKTPTPANTTMVPTLVQSRHGKGKTWHRVTTQRLALLSMLPSEYAFSQSFLEKLLADASALLCPNNNTRGLMLAFEFLVGFPDAAACEPVIHAGDCVKPAQAHCRSIVSLFRNVVNAIWPTLSAIDALRASYPSQLLLCLDELTQYTSHLQDSVQIGLYWTAFTEGIWTATAANIRCEARPEDDADVGRARATCDFVAYVRRFMHDVVVPHVYIAPAVQCGPLPESPSLIVPMKRVQAVKDNTHPSAPSVSVPRQSVRSMAESLFPSIIGKVGANAAGNGFVDFCYRHLLWPGNCADTPCKWSHATINTARAPLAPAPPASGGAGRGKAAQ